MLLELGLRHSLALGSSAEYQLTNSVVVPEYYDCLAEWQDHPNLEETHHYCLCVVY
jgi:hypothetical protein